MTAEAPIRDTRYRTPISHVLLLSTVLSVGVVGWTYLVHVWSGAAHHAGNAVAHGIRDIAISLPVAVAAVCIGLWIANRSGGHGSGALAAAGRAATVSLVFAVLVIPAVGIHQAIDSYLDGPAAGALSGLEHDASLVGLATHGTRDALIGQAVGLPLLLGAFLLLGAAWRSNRRRARTLLALPRTAGLRAAYVAGFAAMLSLATVVSPAEQASAAPADVDSHTGNPCLGAPQRTYNVSAINVRITLNRFGVNDPNGLMYVLDQNIAAVRAQEQSGQVSIGLGSDPIQPLVIRANLGDCLTINFTNRTTFGLGQEHPPPLQDAQDPEQVLECEEAAEAGTPCDGQIPRVAAVPLSMHFHGVSYRPSDSAGSEVGDNPNTFVAPGATRRQFVYVDPQLGEGAHTFHSHGESRQENGHGLFGALIAEPAGSQWLEPATLQPLASGWNAVIRPPTGPTFREFAILYHEIGDEGYRGIMERDGVTQVPVVDPFTDTYRPCSRGFNYRSECFFERMKLLDQNGFIPDESQQYGSYMNGDMATPMPQGYVGDPHKTRLMHAGSEMGHVHHYHGGAIRWRRNPGADNTDIAGGLKKLPIQNARSIRLDSQTIEPGESYSLEHECGLGGCQQAAGDFLFHCHVAHHYLAGMLGFVRVFDTAQGGLATLPGRSARPSAVNSAGLIGRVIEGRTVVPRAELTDPGTQIALETLVESQLPPQGVRLNPQDATVWNYAKGGTSTRPVYFGEPEDTRSWPNYTSPTPGARPEIKFNPANGRYAWPLLRPHLGMRPPFSPNGHSGTPWLGPTVTPNRPDGLCPANAPVRRYNITAIQVTINESKGGLTPAMVDQNGQIFVLNEDRRAVQAGTKPADPLAIRSNVGDCVAVTLSSQLNDTAENHQFSKVNLHTHFVQFDPQASDGVITGLSYEQSVRPAQSENRTLTAAVAAGARQISVTSTAQLRPGIGIMVGQGEIGAEVATISAISASTVTLAQPLASAHAAGERAGVEFVQYRWYSDVDSGTVFFHDHVDGIHSWGHGLFAAHIIEPAGSTYHDPVTGAEVRSGPIVDIHTGGSVGVGQQGSFREYMLWLHNGVRGDGGTHSCEGGSINLRATPLKERDPNPGDDFNLGFSSLTEPAGPDRADCVDQINAQDPYVFSSVAHGDPATPLLRAYAGDPVVVRTIGLVEHVGSLRFMGHRFAAERFNTGGTITDAGTTGISERFDYILEGGAGGPRRLPGDYLYYSSRSMEMQSGAWGIFRVHDRLQPNLRPLPGRTPATGPGFPQLGFTGAAPPQASGVGGACPSNVPVRSYDVTIFETGQELEDAEFAYALSDDVDDILAGTQPLVPLAIRANRGECLRVTLTNDVESENMTFRWGTGTTRAGFSVGNLISDPQRNGVAIGFNPDSSVAPGGTRAYQYYVDKEVGTTLALNFANDTTMARGGYAVVIAEPAGSTYRNSRTGLPVRSGVAADILVPNGQNFREFVVTAASDEHDLGHSIMEYDVESDDGALNYVQESLIEAREAGVPKWKVFSSTFNGDDPDSPVFLAYAGDPVRFRVAAPSGNNPFAFHVEGHAFPLDHGITGSMIIDTRLVMPGQTFDAHLIRGAGGALRGPGDYLYQEHQMVFLQTGLWGIFRVLPPPGTATAATAIQPL